MERKEPADCAPASPAAPSRAEPDRAAPDHVQGRRLFLKLVLLTAVVILTACSGPSKAQYVKLLHECREANREHLRMIKEYDAANCDSRPEQGFGTVEMGIGGVK